MARCTLTLPSPKGREDCGAASDGSLSFWERVGVRAFQGPATQSYHDFSPCQFFETPSNALPRRTMFAAKVSPHPAYEGLRIILRDFNIRVYSLCKNSIGACMWFRLHEKACHYSPSESIRRSPRQFLGNMAVWESVSQSRLRKIWGLRPETPIPRPFFEDLGIIFIFGFLGAVQCAQSVIVRSMRRRTIRAKTMRPGLIPLS